MERKRLVRCAVLMLSVLISACENPDSEKSYAEVRIGFRQKEFSTKAIEPDENTIHDANILVFDRNGMLEYAIWCDKTDIADGIELKLLDGKEYRFMACVNFGYEITATTLEEMIEHRYHMAYPDEYQRGIPMSADTGLICIENDSQITLDLKRMMSKISLRIDRRKLSETVEMKVRSVTIGNCPKSASVFKSNTVEGLDDCFSLGFHRNAEECTPLNQLADKGISKEISLYMFENIQGSFSKTDIIQDSEKVFEKDDPRQYSCSYIEILMDYVSPQWKSIEEGLIYRFYLGEDKNNLDVERNCHYRITICPENDGLSEDSWRVDKTHIVPTGPVSFSSWPESYILGDIGDKIHIGCTFTPSYAPFDVGIEYMMEDKARGIYDFDIDPDGHGATLTLTGPGRGLIYMEVGEPVNEAAMWIIEVNLPDS